MTKSKQQKKIPFFKKPAQFGLFYFVLLLWCSCGKEKIEIFWEEQTTGVSSALTSVYFTDKLTGHVIGGDTWFQGYYLSTEDGGDTWTVDSLTNKKMFDLQFLEDGYGVTVGINGAVYRKETPDAPWKFLRIPRWDIMRGVAYKNRNDGIVVGGVAYGFGVVLRLENNVMTQMDTLENELDAVAYSDDNTVHAVGFGIVMRSDDSGDNWTRLNVYGDFFRAIHFPSETVGYVVGSGGTILKTTDGGQQWKKIRKGEKASVSNVPFRDVYFMNEDRGYVVGEDGTFWRTTNGGDDWEIIKDFPNVDLLGIHMVNEHGYVVSEQGRIFHFIDE